MQAGMILNSMGKRRLFALSDPHLSSVSPKPMDVFGSRWRDHVNILGRNWREMVGADDVILVPGDISWAMRLDGALPDLQWLASLPGEKILVRGNHDYWWQPPAKLRAANLPTMHFIQNNHVIIGGLAAGGTRLWDFPGIVWSFAHFTVGAAVKAAGQEGRDVDPEKIRVREIGRLKMSLSGIPKNARLKVALTHYPPLGEDGLPTPITEIICGMGVDICVFGHVHAPSEKPRPGEDIVIGKTRFVLASSDHIGHSPKFLAEF